MGAQQTGLALADTRKEPGRGTAFDESASLFLDSMQPLQLPGLAALATLALQSDTEQSPSALRLGPPRPSPNVVDQSSADPSTRYASLSK